MSEDMFVYDLNKISYKEVQSLNLTEGLQQEEMSLKLVVKTLVSWPFDKEITVDNIQNLGLLDFVKLQTAFTQELEDAFKSQRETK